MSVCATHERHLSLCPFAQIARTDYSECTEVIRSGRQSCLGGTDILVCRVRRYSSARSFGIRSAAEYGIGRQTGMSVPPTRIQAQPSTSGARRRASETHASTRQLPTSDATALALRAGDPDRLPRVD